MQITTYYLGANTPEGFASHYDTLFRDERIKQLVILKGGPGCGKSTLMRRVGEAALHRGCPIEQILCSSDPDSLDGVIIPRAGLALVDGTAPHVVEPPICGLGACYLDLGRFYDAQILEDNRAALEQAKAQNAACYPLCYLALKAAGSFSAACRLLADEALPALPEALTDTLPPVPPAQSAPSGPQCRFISAISPKGLRQEALPVGQLFVLRDSYGVGASLLETVSRRYTLAGHGVIHCYDPLAPASLQALLVPALDTGFVRSSRLFPFAAEQPLWGDLDALVGQHLSYAKEQQLTRFEQLRTLAAEQALQQLKLAKQHHDALEAACRPAVDFRGLDETAAGLLAVLDRLLT